MRPAPTRERLIRTEYTGPAGSRQAASVTLENAIRAAVLRLLSGQYTAATIHDCRFGSAVKNTAAVHITIAVGVLTVRWNPATLFPRDPSHARTQATAPARKPRRQAQGAQHARH